MNELNIKFEEYSPQGENRKVIIDIENNMPGDFLYKVLVGYNGKWNIIRDYDENNTVIWEVDLKGHYMIMVQAKEKNSKKPFDYTEKAEYMVGEVKEISIEISNLRCLNNHLVTGEYITFEVGTKQKTFRTILYKFIKISPDGTMETLREYARDNYISYVENFPGKFKLLVLAKYEDCAENFEDRAIVNYEVKPCDKVFIQNFFKIDRDKNMVVSIENKYNNGVIGALNASETFLNKPVYLRGKLLIVEAQYGEGIEEFTFLVKRNRKVIHSERNMFNNYICYVPEEIGNYVIEVKVKSESTGKEEVVHGNVEFRVLDYEPAKMDYVLKYAKDGYIAGKSLFFEVIGDRNSETLVKYDVILDGMKIYSNDYSYDKEYIYVPKAGGKYIFQFYAKNVLSTEEYDDIKVVDFYVQEVPKLRNIKLLSDKSEIRVGEPVTFMAQCDSEDTVLYEFYMMSENEWRKVQGFSRKNYYTFIPFKEGLCKFLMMCKNASSIDNYDEYCQYHFKVEKNKKLLEV